MKTPDPPSDRKSDRPSDQQSDRPALPELVTPVEVAALFGVDAKTVTRWVLRGRLPGVRTPSGHHRFRKEEVLRLLERAGAVR
ncbi:helix-turn-helix domain-containing protein [Nocardiopsis flavescens]|uniref:helix-turn-helix domain-containing protein n=1 Tax=Nocardiopsis flavescens TaxID=758803 RepID=UPI00366216FD